MRCLAECPDASRAVLIDDIPSGLHACNVEKAHIHHHCGACGSEWDENLRASTKLKMGVWQVVAS